MTKIDIISGFLGAGKTTLIKKLIKEGYQGQKLVIIENEFGQIGIDGGFLQDSGIQVTEMNSGCICCSLVGDFGKALSEVIEKYTPDRVIIEPSGVGKLSDVITAVKNADCHGAELNSYTAVVDAKKCKIYHKNFGEFFNNQIESASTVILSHTAGLSQDKLDKCIEIVKELNDDALVVTTDWDELSGKQLVDAIENGKKSVEEALEIEHHHHHHEHDEHCNCGCHDHEHEHHHHHEHDEHCDCGCHDHEHEHHHHHEHDEHCDCGCHDREHEHHHHHHEHDEHCDCGCHDHEHHHHADEVFTSWGVETATKFTKEKIQSILDTLMSDDSYGTVLRAKGIVAGENAWIHFDYIPGEADVREGLADVTGRICVIGSKLNEEKLEQLFK